MGLLAVTGPHATSAFAAVAAALGAMLRLDFIIARNPHIVPAFSLFRRLPASFFLHHFVPLYDCVAH
jgi:hypothetical protein